MELTAAKTLALTLMGEHDLISKGWTFKFDGAERRMGLCSYGPKSISISRHYANAATEAEVRNTILHEIAHALVGPYEVDRNNRIISQNGRMKKSGHGYQWKSKARSIGCTGDRCGVNPYYRAKKDAEHAANGVAIGEPAFEEIFTGFYNPLARRGDRIVSGALIGTVEKVARTRYHFVADKDGRTYHVPFNNVRFLEGGKGANAALPARERPAAPAAASALATTPVIPGAPLRTGNPVAINYPGSKYHNATGVIVKVNQTTYTVMTDVFGRMKVGKTLIVAREAGTDVKAASATDTPVLGRNSKVTIYYPGSKYHGKNGVIVKVNTKTYGVDVEGEGRITASMGLLRPRADAANAA